MPDCRRDAVDVSARTDRLSFAGLAGERIVEPGIVWLSVGLSVWDRTRAAELSIEGRVRVVGVGRELLRTPARVS